jgi:diacylglycerol kinase
MTTPPRKRLRAPSSEFRVDREPGTSNLELGTPREARNEMASFGYAFSGLYYTWKTQPHLRVHAVLAVLAILLGVLFSLSWAEWAVLLATITLVIALELINTVVEAVVDLVTTDYHPLAKVAKDVAAGAVLVAAGGAIAVGAVLFLPRLLGLLAR